MAKLTNYRTLKSEDFPDTPEYFTRLLEALNKTLKEIVDGLQNQLSLDDNFNSDKKDVSFSHNKELIVTFHKIKGTIRGFNIIWVSDGYSIDSYSIRMTANNALAITILFTDAAAVNVNCRLQVMGE